LCWRKTERCWWRAGWVPLDRSAPSSGPSLKSLRGRRCWGCCAPLKADRGRVTGGRVVHPTG
jgi:hypothetical protein